MIITIIGLTMSIVMQYASHPNKGIFENFATFADGIPYVINYAVACQYLYLVHALKYRFHLMNKYLLTKFDMDCDEDYGNWYKLLNF